MKIIIAALMALASLSASAKELQWQGHTWLIVEGKHMMPGPNNWEPSNAWVDADGALNLRVDEKGAAMVIAKDKMGFGTYRWEVEGDLNHLDPNAVFGLFQYPQRDQDTTKELNIEIAQWGDPRKDRLGYVVWPDHKVPNYRNRHTLLKLKPGNTFSFGYTRADRHVSFDGWDVKDDLVTNDPMRVQMSLWAIHERQVQPVTIKIRSFKFTPAN